MMKNAGVTLMEILVIVIVIGILVAIALPNFTRVREDVLDKEAQASLRLMQAAQRIYRMEVGSYYPVDPATVIDNARVNADLNLSLPTDANRNWNYGAQSTGTGCVNAQNLAATRGWFMVIAGTEPQSGLSCP